MSIQRSYLLFENACQTEATKKQYQKGLVKFLEFSKILDHNDFAKMETQSIQVLLEDYVFYLKNKGVRRTTVRGYLQPVELFLEVNRIAFHKRSLHLLYPKDDKKSGSEKPYLTEDIQKMLLSTTSKRNKAVIQLSTQSSFPSVGKMAEPSPNTGVGS